MGKLQACHHEEQELGQMSQRDSHLDAKTLWQNILYRDFLRLPRAFH
jgi:hypothetical protein